MNIFDQTKCECSLLSKVFNKALDEKDKKKIFKNTKKIECKNELKMIKNGLGKANENAFKKLTFISKLGLDSREIFYKIKELHKEIDYTKLVCIHTNENIYDFNIFRKLDDFIRSIYYVDILLEQAMDKQYEMEALLRSLDVYKP